MERKYYCYLILIHFNLQGEKIQKVVSVPHNMKVS